MAKNKRPTRAQLSERLSSSLGPKDSIPEILEVDPDSFAAQRQRIRDRAGDEPLPNGPGRSKK
jgi:hypothetical protein